MKRFLRKILLDARKAMKIEDVESKSEIIVKSLLENFILKNKNVGIYYPIRNEVDILALRKIEDINLFLPRVNGENLEFVAWNKSIFYADHFNIPTIKGVAADLSVLDYIILPIVGFNKERYRIGYGKAFYDKIMKQMKDKGVKCKYVGVAYSFQLCEFPPEPHDQPLDFIITEAETI